MHGIHFDHYSFLGCNSLLWLCLAYSFIAFFYTDSFFTSNIIEVSNIDKRYICAVTTCWEEKKMKMFCKAFISGPEKKVSLFFFPQTCTLQNYLQAFLLLFFIWDRCFLLQYLFLSFRKSREGAYHVSYTEEKLKLSIIITICIISRGQLT